MSSLVSALPSGYAPGLTNNDLLPTGESERRWTWWHFAALWMGMVHNIFNFTWIGGLVVLGMSVWQALAVALAGNLVQTALIGLNGRVGAHYGLPFAVWARSAFGVYGANVAALARGAVAVGWFGVQSYLAATAINLLITTVVPGWGRVGHSSFLGMAPSLWAVVVGYWLLNFVVVRNGMGTIRRFESWAGPAIFVVMAILLVWVVVRAGGAGSLLHQHAARYPTTSDFLAHGFVPAVSLYIAGSWAAMVLNIPDLTRFARSNRQQFWGTMIGLPAASLVYFGMAAVIVSAVQRLYGQTLWNPTDVLATIGNPALSIVGATLLAIATISVNIPANIVSPAYDLTNLLPRLLTFRTAAYLSIVLGFLAMPWQLLSSPETLYSVLHNIGVVIGPITGIMLADYFVIRRQRMDVAQLFSSMGRYRYRAGYNPVALTVLALVVALLLAAEASSRLHDVYEHAWLVGVSTAFIGYTAAAGLARRGSGPVALGLAPGEDVGSRVAASAVPVPGQTAPV
jgi:NCS1 family nucleobase:cation symporter-1